MWSIPVIRDTMLVDPPRETRRIEQSVTLIEPRIGTACTGAATSANSTVPAAVKSFTSFNMAAPSEVILRMSP